MHFNVITLELVINEIQCVIKLQLIIYTPVVKPPYHSQAKYYC